MPWKLYSHILDILSFPLLISVSSSFLLFWRASLEIRDHWPYGSTRDPHTHTVCAHKACVAMKNARGETLRKAHNSPLPQKSGSERVVVWGGSVMVLMWEAGWVNIPDGRGTDNDEGRTREESQNQGWCSVCNKKPEDFHNLLPQDTHTQTQRHAHLSQISE